MPEVNVGRSSELLEAPAFIWNQTFNFIKSATLKCAVQLGIPDIIQCHGQPMPLSKLVSQLPIDPSKAQCIYRLMRVLVHSGLFLQRNVAGDDDRHEEVEYTLTPASRLLLKKNPLSASQFLLSMLDPALLKPWHFLTAFLTNGDPSPFHTTNGCTIWDCASHEPMLNDFLNEAMASDARLVASVVIKECKGAFGGLGSLVDVGGGTGTVARAVADAFPNMECTVFDLPHVVANLQGSGNLKFVGGDMFEAISPPADAIFLKWILHDWSDEECVKILKQCKKAIPSKEKGGKVIIIDMVVGKHKGEDDHQSVETQLFFDMMMMVLATGKERSEKEWAKLFFVAGFSDYKITPILGLRSLIEVFHD